MTVRLRATTADDLELVRAMEAKPDASLFVIRWSRERYALAIAAADEAHLLVNRPTPVNYDDGRTWVPSTGEDVKPWSGAKGEAGLEPACCGSLRPEEAGRLRRIPLGDGP